MTLVKYTVSGLHVTITCFFVVSVLIVVVSIFVPVVSFVLEGMTSGLCLQLLNQIEMHIKIKRIDPRVFIKNKSAYIFSAKNVVIDKLAHNLKLK